MNDLPRERLVRNPLFLLAVEFILMKKFALELGQAFGRAQVRSVKIRVRPSACTSRPPKKVEYDNFYF